MLRNLFVAVALGSACFNAAAQDTLVNKTVNEPASRKIIRAVAAPVLLTGAGLLMIDADHDNDLPINRYWVADQRNKNFSSFHTVADSYLMFTPIAAVYGLDIAGVKGRHDIANQTALLIKSELVMLAIVYPLKNTTNVLRPDGSDRHSFPSGHTAEAFAAATFLHKEYGHKSIWISVGGYSAASAVGVFRMLNNRHWFSDVLVGAGVGILSTNVVYLTHQNRWGKKGGVATLLPSYNKGAGFYFSYQFK